MKKAFYNNGLEIVELTILRDNGDRLDLSADGVTLKVGGCPIDNGDHGWQTIGNWTGNPPAHGQCRRIDPE
jgi:hypothetical protein